MGFRGNHLSPWFVVSLLLSLAIIARSSENSCVYTILIKTGFIDNAGTDSNIGVVLGDATSDRVTIPNIVYWGGMMPPGHNYFENGNLDVFEGSATCLKGPVCLLNLTSDGTGTKPGWFCNYVEVTTSGVQKEFIVDHWLATDEPPYQLFAARDLCNSKDDGVGNNISVRAVSSDVGNDISVPAVSSDAGNNITVSAVSSDVM